MGYRSTLCTSHARFDLPDWFIEKYDNIILNLDGTLLVSLHETSRYDNVFFSDYRAALEEAGVFSLFREVYACLLSEGGKVTMVTLTIGGVRYMLMEEDFELKGIYDEDNI